jgi:hypothetical protein
MNSTRDIPKYFAPRSANESARDSRPSPDGDVDLISAGAIKF